MSRVLVVDDSRMDRLRAGKFLESASAELTVAFAEDGRDALRQIEETLPDLIVTDLQMPEMDGMELVRSVKDRFPRLPVILITAEGSEDIAAKALREGAVSYVPKSTMAQVLTKTVEQTLLAASRDRMHSRLMHALDNGSIRFTIQNDPELIELVTRFFEEMLRGIPLGDEGERLRCGTAIQNAMNVAWQFGNLEIPANTATRSELNEVLQTRADDPALGKNSLTISAQIQQDSAEFIVTHEGAPLLPPASGTPSAVSEMPYERAFLLMHSAMDDVTVAPDGYTLRLRRIANADDEFTAVEDSVD